MDKKAIEHLRFPIGRFTVKEQVTEAHRAKWIEDIRQLPDQLSAEVAALTDHQLDTPYRPEGWTARQVVHHIADSHINGYCRMKLALTEDNPVIKPYDQRLWAETDEAKTGPIDYSLAILRGLHRRWVHLLQSVSDIDYQRTFIHPETGRSQSVELWLSIYAWHGQHHLAHITSLKQREGWA